MDEKTYNKKSEAALLEWINSFPINQRVRSLNSLNDGHIIWKVLGDIDPTYFHGSLPEGPSNSGRWVSRWQNLKQICKCLISYIVEECGQKIPNGPATGDLKLIAMDSVVAETLKAGVLDRKYVKLGAFADHTTQLLKLVLLASINSPRATEYIARMPTFSTSTQASLKIIIEEVMNDDVRVRRRNADMDQIQDFGNNTGNGFGHDSGRASTPINDPELLFEERVGRIMAENDLIMREKKDLQKDLRELHNRLIRLQENNDVLQDRLMKAEDRLRKNSSASNANKESSIKQLESKIRSQENIIAEQEVKLSEYQSSVEAMTKTVDRLHASSGKSQKLRDEIDELRIERDGLSKKANTAERYKQKLQATQDLQKQNDELLEELNEVRQQFTIADKARQQVTSLQLALEEYKRILPKIEQDRHELQMMKKQLEFDNAALAQRWEEANEQHARDQESIANLTDKLSDFELGRASISINGEGLDSELEGVTRRETLLRAKVAELETVNQQLQATITLHASKNTALEQLLEDAKERQDERDRKNLEVYQEKLMLESSLAAVEQGDPIQGTEVFKKMRDQVGMEQQRSAELEAEISTLKSELQVVENDSSPDDTKRQTVNEVKRQVNELQKENRSLKKQSRDMKMELDEQKRNTMDEKDIKQHAGGSDQELMAILQDLKTATAERPTLQNGENKGLDNQISLLADKIIDGRERLSKRAEHIKKQNTIIKDLEDRLVQESGRQSSPAVLPSANSEEQVTKLASQARLIENLKRENKLMASAFHDLSSRLQMNSVVLQRREEAPRSWLNKQRKLVDQPALAIGR